MSSTDDKKKKKDGKESISHKSPSPRPQAASAFPTMPTTSDEKKKATALSAPKREKKDKPKKELKVSTSSASIGSKALGDDSSHTTEVQELENAASTLDPAWLELSRSPFTEEKLAAYEKLNTFARQFNCLDSSQWIPEYVFVGKQGSGKTSIIEAILGHHFHTGPTRRPLHLTIIHNSACLEPKITLKANLSSSSSMSLSVSELPSEIEHCNAQSEKLSSEPIYIRYETCSRPSVVLIDTPGLVDDEDGGNVEVRNRRQEIEQIALKMTRNTKRRIIWVHSVESSSSLSLSSSASNTSLPSAGINSSGNGKSTDIDFIKQKVDPMLARTTIIYSKFHTVIQSMSSTKEINRYLIDTIEHSEADKVFLLSMFSQELRLRLLTSASPPSSTTPPSNNTSSSFSHSFELKLYQSYKRDLNALEKLQFNTAYQTSIGLHAIRKYIYDSSWSHYQNSIPQLLQQIRLEKTNTDNEMKIIKRQISQLGCLKARVIGNDYVTEFLQILQDLLSGTSEGLAIANGQSGEEEKRSYSSSGSSSSNSGGGLWQAGSIQVRVENDWNIPHWNTRLYGGQQFQRLLSEFRSVVEHLKIDPPSIDEIATAVGINRSNTLPNYTLSACIVAAQKLQDSFRPLIEELCSRASYIFSRLPQIVDSIIVARRKSHRNTLNRLTQSSDPSGFSEFGGGVSSSLNLGSYLHGTSSGSTGRGSSLVETYYRANTYFQFRGEPDYLEEKQIIDVEEAFPYFHFHIRDLYYNFINEIIDNARNKCLDEFLSEETIYWNFLSENKDRAQTPKDASRLASSITDQHQAALAKTILLKFHQYFLVELQQTLWSSINGKYLSLSDIELEQKFELKATGDKLGRKQKRLEQALLQYVEVENVFFDANKKIFHYYPLSSLVPPNIPSQIGMGIGSGSALSGSFGNSSGSTGTISTSGSSSSIPSSVGEVASSTPGHVRTASSSSNISGELNDDE